jgi:hypothetical protein
MGTFCIRSPANKKQEAPQPIATVSPHISGIFCPLPQSAAVLLSLIKNRRHNRNLSEPSAFPLLFLLFPAIPLLAKLKLVRQYLLGTVSADQICP